MPSHYHAFTRNLVARLESDPAILGIVALGSMAEQRGRAPDRWSDHDFFVITAEPEPYRERHDWLPAAENIALWFRETAHGCKAVYDDGHLVEYAVFAPDELRLARVNDYRVLLDRERIADRLAQLTQHKDAPPSREWLHGMFLSHILVAASRACRGETASARWMLTHAMRFLAQILGGGDDDLDPLRRFPGSETLELAMRSDPAKGADELLTIYERECGGDARAVSAIRASFPSARE